MVEHRECNFCGQPIEPGTGTLFIKKDGTQLSFCGSKCRHNLLDLKRQPRYFKWTRAYTKGGVK